jgi:hypothetical protein
MDVEALCGSSMAKMGCIWHLISIVELSYTLVDMQSHFLRDLFQN